MILGKVFERFVEESPVSVMFRGTLENVLSAERLDRLFLEYAQRQNGGRLLFSTITDLLGQVVCRIKDSVNSAYKDMKDRDRISVSVKSVYDKLAGVEPVVCEALVRETAQHLGAIITEMQSEPVLSIRGDR